MSKIKAATLQGMISVSKVLIGEHLKHATNELDNAIQKLDPVDTVKEKYQTFFYWAQIETSYNQMVVPPELCPEHDLRQFETMLYGLESGTWDAKEYFCTAEARSLELIQWGYAVTPTKIKLPNAEEDHVKSYADAVAEISRDGEFLT